jgi:uncharacterized membrane protein
MEAYSDDVIRPLGLLEVTFSSLWFLAAMAYIRTRRQAPGASNEQATRADNG